MIPNLQELLNKLNGNLSEQDIVLLEGTIKELQRLHAENSDSAVPDSIYDTLYERLKEVKPDSDIFSDTWEHYEDSTALDSRYTTLLDQHPMYSIETVKSYTSEALAKFMARLPEQVEMFASYKINGHGIRCVYENGYFVSATSRARSSDGRDLTRQLSYIMPDYIEDFANYSLVELRGELCLKTSKLEIAREFNKNIVSAFSAVASLVKPSASREEVELLDFLCYGVYADGLSFETRLEEFEYIESVGLSYPEYVLPELVSDGNMMDYIVRTVKTFEENYEIFGYFCDGVVLEVNNRELFESLGIDGNHNKGNVALKVGVWKQDVYTGYIQTILWTKGKTKLSPVAVVADMPDMAVLGMDNSIVNMQDLGVMTAQGNKVRRVPLYEPKNIIALNAYLGYPLCFRYGGEAGVVPCYPDGRLLTDVVKEDTDLFKGFELDEETGEFIEE